MNAEVGLWNLMGPDLANLEQVLWLMLAFGWGVMRVMDTTDTKKHGLKIEDDDSSEWSFGQVMSIVLLAASIITLLEYFDHSMYCLAFTGWRVDLIASRCSK